MDVSGLVVTNYRLLIDMRWAKDVMDVPPRKFASCVGVVVLRVLCVRRL